MSNAYLTQSDVDKYGRDLIDVTQRAAMHAVTPHLQLLAEDNAMLQQRLAREARHRLDAQLERAVPNFREIDRDPAWHRYLLGIDALSGRVRQTLLNEAIASGSADRVAAFFRGFQQAAGSTQAPTAARAQMPSGQIYTRAQIAKLYRQHQQGAYNGREAEWQRLEADIIAAGREGRIRNPVFDVNGK
jgi:hypothetical protein